MTNQEFTDLYCEALNKIKPIRDKYEKLGVQIHLDAHASSGRNYAMNIFVSNNNPHLSTLIMFVDGDKYHSFSSKRIDKVIQSLDAELEQLFREHPQKTEQEKLAEQIAQAEDELKKLKKDLKRIRK